MKNAAVCHMGCGLSNFYTHDISLIQIELVKRKAFSVAVKTGHSPAFFATSIKFISYIIKSLD